MEKKLKDLLVLALYSFLGAMIVYAIWIEPYLRAQGKKTASILLTLIGYPGPILDYLKGRKVARRRGHTPWFFRAFESLIAVTLLALLGSLALFLWDRFGRPGDVESGVP